jgi:hypothetical protein
MHVLQTLVFHPQWGNTPTIDEILERLDLGAIYLTATRGIQIVAIGPDGKKVCDEVKTSNRRRAQMSNATQQTKGTYTNSAIANGMARVSQTGTPELVYQ